MSSVDMRLEVSSLLRGDGGIDSDTLDLVRTCSEHLDLSRVDSGLDAIQLHSAKFSSFDERAAELAADVSEGHLAVLEAFAEQCCLVKVVRNFCWMELVHSLRSSPFRTSTTLTPPGGKTMKLFGQVSTSSVGLIWDRRKLDLSDAFIWPSGYFAKSEFNVGDEGKMENGRKEALVTLESVLHANATLTYQRGGSTITGGVMPFNEVLVRVNRAEGLVGIFARSTCVKHLLLAMGIRALLLRSLPEAGELPLFVLDPEQGVRPFSRVAESQLLRELLVPARPSTGFEDVPRFPLDTQSLDLGWTEQLEVNGAFGVTRDALHQVVGSLLAHHKLGEEANRQHTCEVRAILAFGLRAAVVSNNAASALALVRELSPWLCSRPNKPAADELVLTFESGSREQVNSVPSSLPSDADLSAYLHTLASQAQSQAVLVTIGAAILLDEFASGRMMARIVEACKELEGWLRDSQSFFFRLRSWRELQTRRFLSRKPSVSSFVTHKAIANRSRFHNKLQELEDCHDALGCVTKLNGIVGELHHPCLRLEMLQRILGLNDRYDLKAVVDVATLAERIVQDSNGKVQDGVNIADVQGVLPNKDGSTTYQFEACALHMQGLDFDQHHQNFRSASLKLR